MAKYFVQSGTLRTTVDAENGQKAALWAVHQAMQQVLPVDDEQHTSQCKATSMSESGPSVMDHLVFVSEVGFDDEHPTRYPTMDVVRQWNEMLGALQRLEQLLGDRGLAA
ncbi:hypothetical protein [Roseiconus lacunae]|uniref:Uncharacterized protein n=1 Tax=Roseiconus lacunae TaxID=2605694 RepID=A0ABT7PNN8_9BACT|nr:hypothetical protein [Roseiconus lacunae]MCD0463280.1 hypothetical protein [Roseiconus lacunae]MDM4017906.1 hypothetical protein [Roseiconus lacunae]WRQ52518.1 hypothetical protein U8335_08215 [Stieleria sp. HD01]